VEMARATINFYYNFDATAQCTRWTT